MSTSPECSELRGPFRLGACTILAAVGLACGTGAAPAGGDRDLPNARMGPFRVLRVGETSRDAPFVYDNGAWRDPEVVSIGAAPGEKTRLYFTGGGAAAANISSVELGQAIMRPEDVPVRVLEASEEWEQNSVSAPSVLFENGRYVLFYASGGGCVGRAVSADGLAFTREPTTPVLCGDGGLPITSPNVVRRADGGLSMFHGYGDSILESRSEGGLAFTLGLIVLSPSGIPASYDEATVGDPYAAPVLTTTGRPIRYVFFTATASTGIRSVGMSARFDDDGGLVRGRDAVLTRYEPRSPSVLVFPTTTLLYASSARAEAGMGKEQAAILAAIAPATEARPLDLPKPASSTASP